MNLQDLSDDELLARLSINPTHLLNDNTVVLTSPFSLGEFNGALEELQCRLKRLREELKRRLAERKVTAQDSLGVNDINVVDIQWQDISTAPKDATLVLIYAPERKIRTAYWHHYAGWEDISGADMNEATHWMPLPQPPKEN